MIEVINCDALDVPLDVIESCHVLVSDFPYSAHVHASAVSTRTGGAGVRKRDFGFEHLSPALRARGAKAAARVSRWSVIFSDHEGTHEWRVACVAAGAEYIRTVPWIRWSQPQISGDRPGQGSEAVLLFHATSRGRPIKKHWNGSGGLTHFSERCLRGEDKHPTEKPLDLMLALVSAFSDPGETILDLAAGSGTTALACRILDRNCIAIEINPRWADHGRARVNSDLATRDRDRLREWIDRTGAEAHTVPAPKGAHDIRTWERAQRRLADVERARAAA